MPLLTRETNVFPEDLLTRSLSDLRPELDADIQWYAFYTRSRHEKKFMRKLLENQVPFYCPIVSCKRKSPAGRVRVSHQPLFSNYVFVLGDANARLAGYETNCVSHCLEVKTSEELHSQLFALDGLINSGAPLTVESRLTPGTPVRIKSGPLRGVEGTVFNRRGIDRLLITVNLLQQGASIELSDWEVEPL